MTKFIVMKKFLFITVVLLGWFSNVFSQNQRFKRLSLKEGLSQSTANCVIQDKMGLIWIATQDGLNKFDGNEFTHYKKLSNNTNSIPDNNVQSLFEDSKGYIWIGTYGSGVAIYNPKTDLFKHLNSFKYRQF